MGDVAELVQTVFKVFEGQAGVPVQVSDPSLGMTYAIPRGTEATVVDSYAPWHAADVKQVFYRQSAIVGSTMVEAQLIMRWRYSEAQQYIINGDFAVNLLSLDPTVNVSVTVGFDTPSQYDPAWEAYEIPFHVTVLYDPIAGGANRRSSTVRSARTALAGSIRKVLDRCLSEGAAPSDRRRLQGP